MTLNASGPISLAGTTVGQSIEIELGGSGTTTISLNDTAVRTLAGVASGPISMPTDFWGKANRVSLSKVFSVDTADALVNMSTLPGYIAGKSDITITINSGVYMYSTTTASGALIVTGGTTGDTLSIVNNGYIMGMGGTGGTNGGVGGNGGPAIVLGYSATINNTNASAYIGGGGGGGGGSTSGGPTYAGGGGGVGGGAGGGPSGGAGGGVGASGSDGSAVTGGGGGGRVFPGVGAPGVSNATAAGKGGTGGGSGAVRYGKYSITGGAGGSSNSAGGNGYYPVTQGGTQASGGGGGWGASGGTGYGAVSGSGGGSGGQAVKLNGNTVTWVSGDTTRVWGAVS